MANSISYASKYTAELDKMIVQKAKTGFFADNALKARFTGARTVLIPEMSMVGLGNYSRTEGYVSGDTTLVHTPYTLGQERSRQLTIDAQDVDESGVPNLVGEMVGEYTRQFVIPELDAYVISTLATKAAALGHSTVYSADSGVSALLAAINSVEAACGYDGTVPVVLASPTMYALLMTSTELSRHITVSDFKQGGLDLKVKSLNGAAIVPVSADRMYTAIKLNPGESASQGGYSPAEGAAAVHAVVCPRDACSFVKKVDKIRTFTPDDNKDMDAYVIDFRLYYDAFIKTSRKDTIFTITG